jgi:hypothetical protein
MRGEVSEGQWAKLQKLHRAASRVEPECSCVSLRASMTCSLHGLSLDHRDYCVVRAGISIWSGSATQPRASDGKRTYLSMASPEMTAAWDIQDHSGRLGVPAGEGVAEGNEIPYQPGHYKRRVTTSPIVRRRFLMSKCFLPGVPRVTYMPYSIPDPSGTEPVLIVYEYVHAVASYLHEWLTPSTRSNSMVDGDSRGRWEGDTLVVGRRPLYGSDVV